MTSLSKRFDKPIPKSRGTYALILRLISGRTIPVGKLGTFDFPAGYYIYVGSAFGPGGLAGRLGRHLVPLKPGSAPHWHIDYLRRSAPIVEIWFAEHATPREHDWAKLVGDSSGCTLPASRFGASDCRCRSHLFHFVQPPATWRFRTLVATSLPGDGPLQTIKVAAAETTT